MKGDGSVKHVLLWRNSPSVVIGHHQNPWNECNLQEMAKDNVTLARRISGGGCVFHDKGNLNISILYSRTNHNPSSITSILANILQTELLASVVPNLKRWDLLSKSGKKLSGSAFRIVCCFLNFISLTSHHGQCF
eukprot:m.68008 g.68008  ORF g.68008 m.68008 type:complete len:135 (+) comp8233_c0_seq14:344-748(+)